MVAYAAKDGTTADDGTSGHSPYPPVDFFTYLTIARVTGPDTLIALSYPPDTFMLTVSGL